MTDEHLTPEGLINRLKNEYIGWVKEMSRDDLVAKKRAYARGQRDAYAEMFNLVKQFVEANKPRYTLDELLDGMTPDNKPPVSQSGASFALGDELVCIFLWHAYYTTLACVAQVTAHRP